MKDVGSTDSKPTIYFQGKDKGLVLNKTNANAISMMYGPETGNWTGQTISIYPTETEFQGKIVPCIRIKAPGNQDITVFLQQRTNQAPATQQQDGHSLNDLDQEIPF
jgi:hypothetical protein